MGRRYPDLLESGELAERVRALTERLRSCDICPRNCGIDRISGETGFCGAGAELAISSSCVHLGEEPVLVAGRGVGNFFLSGCNLRCVFCQNWQISQRPIPPSDITSPEALAAQMMRFQEMGLPSVGFVSPTHFIPQIVQAIEIAACSGLTLPLIHNSNAYDSVDVIRLLDGIFDIYLPDFKYASNEAAEKYSSAPGYVENAIAVHREMFRQVGELTVDETGAACQGVLVRHLVLPANQSQSGEVLGILAREVSPSIAVSLMAQYYPTHRAREFPLIARGLWQEEYLLAETKLEELGLTEGWVQSWRHSPRNYLPDFDGDAPFD